MELEAGTVVDRYVVEGVVGRGGMAAVYAVRHRVLGTRVALKLLTVAGRGLSDRLLREGRLQASLDHPNVVPVRDVIVVSQGPGLVMPLVTGPSLFAWLRVHTPDPEEIASLFRGVVAGVGHAHARGVIHRDLKPGNILLDVAQGGLVPRVADFGLAKAIEDSAPEGGPVTRTGAMMGTPAYAAPEQLRDAASVDRRADLWALGVILYELLAGRAPFEGTSVFDIIDAVEEGVYRPLVEVRPELAPAWDALVARLLEVDPRQRIDSTDDVIDALDRVAPGGAAPLRPTGLAAQDARRRAERTAIEVEPTWVPALDQPTLTPVGNLARERDAFVGRASEVAALAALLREGASLVTLTGPPGVGKTRLALRAATGVRHVFVGGVWEVRVGEASTADDLADGVAGAIGLELDPQDRAGSLGRALAGLGRALIVLDGFDRCVDLGPSTVGRWLDVPADWQLLVTSREPLRLRGEQVHRVQPLGLPDTDDPEAVFASPAVVLFVDRWRAQGGPPRLDPGHAPLLAEVARRCDGLPVVLELAAARGRHLSLEALLERLDGRLDRQASARRDGGSPTVRAALDWAWDGLNPWERAALAQLAVFQAPFTIDAAEAVVDLAPWPEAPWADEVVAALVDRSLVAVNVEGRRASGAGPRFHLLGVIRRYGEERLAESGLGLGPVAAADARERHAAWHAALGRPERLEALRVEGGALRARQLAEHLPDLVAAARWASDAGAVRVAVHAFAAAREVLERRGPLTLLADLASRVLAVTPPGPDRVRVQLGLADGLARTGAADEARAVLAEADAEALPRELAVQVLLRRARHDAGTTARASVAAALTHLEPLVVTRIEQYELLALRADVAYLDTRLDEARDAHRQARALAEEIGDVRAEGESSAGLAAILADRGDRASARAAYQRARRCLEEAGDLRGMGKVMSNLAVMELDAQRLTEARDLLERSLAIRRRVADKAGEAVVLGHLGMVMVGQGEARGIDHLHAALRLHRVCGNRRFEGYAHGNLSRVLADRGDLAGAADHADAVLAIGRDLEDTDMQGLALADLAEISRRRGDLELARDQVVRAEGLVRTAGMPVSLAVVLVRKVHVLDALGEPAAAARLEAAALLDRLGLSDHPSLSL